MDTRSGLISMRGRTWSSEPLTTQSSGFNPSSITLKPSSWGAPVVTRRDWTLLSASST